MTTIWPEGGPEFTLDESMGARQAHYFHIEAGSFSPEFSAERNNIAFIWGDSGPELRNDNAVYVCSCDGELIPQGEKIALHYNMEIQVGHYLFQTELSTGETLQKELVKGFIPVSGIDAFPELDSLLGEQSYYSGSQDEIHVLAQNGLLEDELRLLGYEYKEYLQWGDQKRDFRPQGIDHTVRLPANDTWLESVVNNVKNKTMTECILGQTSMIDRVISEIGTDEQLCDDERRDDLLYALAPEHVSKREKKVLSQVIYHELHKPGLNSYL